MSIRLSTEQQVQLACSGYKCSVAPAAGGRLTGLSCELDGSSYDLIVPLTAATFEEHHWPKAGAFPMAPFANRLPGAAFMFQGRRRTVASVPGASFGLHGFTHRREWTVEAVTATALYIRYTHSLADEEWAWPFSISQELTLSEDGLSIEFEVTNLSEEPMPIGIGWHPYHPVVDECASLDLEAGHRVLIDDSGRASRSGAPGDTASSRARRYGVAAGETVAFEEWTQKAVIPVASKIEALIAGEGWNRLVVHRPSQPGYACLEPVMLLPGTLGDASTLEGGPGPLHPGHSASARWRCGGRRRTP
jgi:aldose 1-epimerase